ncbi:MAG: hypothetical protein AB8G15_12150 [Saprospiraceae bacterium]
MPKKDFKFEDHNYFKSSFCVYLFGLETLAISARVFFLRVVAFENYKKIATIQRKKAEYSSEYSAFLVLSF